MILEGEGEAVQLSKALLLEGELDKVKPGGYL
jgi:hypothetical protein